ncbi:MAG: DUF3014 domain-containing protein [Proteobacteria bacterium]|jgi:hypothetical protein|nr:DUF3014 domain-containing protein [Pseudomonadota bacterium]MDA0994747.1 DUF3014 domain-containing protein [Pseudomonadota bacterium]
MQKRASQWLIPVILAVGAALALWYYWVSMSGPVLTPVDTLPPAAELPAEILRPLHPVDDVDPVELPATSLVPLPPLDKSDDYFKLEITDIFGDTIASMLVEAGIIQRVVATVDNLPRAHVSEKVRPVGRLAAPFLVDEQDGSGEYTVSVSNYQRYDQMISSLTKADMTAVAGLYRRFYPLFQRAYVDLGYPDGYFNDRLVEVIDHLLETPEVSGPIELVLPHVLYEYADPDLEALSSGQKLLLRLGPDHAGQVKVSLRELRMLVTTM